MALPEEMEPHTPVNAAVLVYDGECPFCSAYVRMLRIRENFDLQLVDARSGAALVQEVVGAGYDLDEGFVLKLQGQYYQGQQALHALALLSSGSGTFNRCTAWVFANKTRARLLYPVLRFCRNLTLRLLGRQPLDLTSSD